MKIQLKTLAVLTGILLLTVNARAQYLSSSDSLRQLLDTTIRIMRREAVRSGDVKWNKLSREVYREAGRVKSVKEGGYLFTRLFDELHDVHGVFLYKDTVFRSSSRPQHADQINEVTLEALKKGPRIITRMLQGNVAYINVPFINVQDSAGVTAMANRLNDSVLSLLKQTPSGLVIDLRLNQGGNMFPMIAGLRSLFGNETVSGGWTYEKHEEPGTYFSNDSLISDYYKIRLNRMATFKDLPVAVLIGPSTASAGECTAAALTFRGNSVLIGEPSMGLTTINNGYRLDSDIGFNLSIGYITDGNGNRLEDYIRPDIQVMNGDNFADLENDGKINAAKDWISKKLSAGL
jgi:C-terminal processing protease CtpA/Prc